jgi:hypothetical protein
VLCPASACVRLGSIAEHYVPRLSEYRDLKIARRLGSISLDVRTGQKVMSTWYRYGRLRGVK